MMNNRSLVVFLFALFMALSVQSQDLLEKMKSDEVITINEKEYWLHKVKRGQTLYMIGKAYGVDVQEIISENPEVKEGLQSGMKIRIPKKSPNGKNKPGLKTEDSLRAIFPEGDAISPESQTIPCGEDKNNMKKVYSIALMMPLFLGEVYAIDANSVSDEEADNLKSLQFLPFYEGFLMAMDSLKKTGYNLKIYVYDVDKDTIKTRKVLRNPEMKNMDLIIGLLYHKSFLIVAEFAKKNSINIVNPLSERDQVVLNNPFIIKVRPSLKSQAIQVAEYIEKNYRGSKVIVLRNTQEKIGNIPDSLKIRMRATSVSDFPNLLKRLKHDSTNIILVFSDNKSYILDIVTKLNEIRNAYPIVLFGLPRWDNISGIEPDYLVNLNTHILAPYFIDYENKGVKSFVRGYQEKYKTDPDKLAFQGFDIAYYFSTALKLYGRNFQSCMSSTKMKLLQTKFEMYHRGVQNGYENSHWEIYMYNNYRLLPVN